jgi:tetratricopeptide (TPR) repeat protein
MKSLESVLFEDSGLFHQHVKKTKKTLEGPNIKEFESLPNLTDKIHFVQKNGPKMEPKVTQIIPDLEKSMALKEEGNKLFKEGRGPEARDKYTQSLQCYPVNKDNIEDNKEYSIILANRSAALDQGGLFEAALQDIDLAFKYGYPREFHFKVKSNV